MHLSGESGLEFISTVNFMLYIVCTIKSQCKFTKTSSSCSWTRTTSI